MLPKEQPEAAASEYSINFESASEDKDLTCTSIVKSMYYYFIQIYLLINIQAKCKIILAYRQTVLICIDI